MSPAELTGGSESSSESGTSSEQGRILESIFKLRTELDRIVTTTGPSMRSQSIQQEIERLEAQFAECKARSAELSEQVTGNTG